jgi:putative addiction module CopG family antidote
MSIELSPRQQTVIEHLVASGSFSDATVAIDRAIQLMELHEQQIAALQAKLQVGLDQVNRGEVVEYTPEFMDEMILETEEAFLRGEVPDRNVWP